MDILEQAPQLDDLKIIEDEPLGVDQGDSATEGSLVLPKLKSLVYLSWFGLNVFSRIQFPHLETLTIGDVDPNCVEFPFEHPHSFPNLHHISTTDPSTTLNVITAFSHCRIQSLELIVGLEGLSELIRCLARGNNSLEDDVETDWSSLVSLSLLMVVVAASAIPDSKKNFQ